MKRFIPACLALLTACAPVTETGIGDIRTLASAAQLSPHKIAAHPFTLLSYERVSQNGTTADIYIEGDGRAWINKGKPSDNPTPANPVALMLATQDTAPNVIYLARPCQYSSQTGDSRCAQKYWTSHRFAPEVIAAIDHALDDLKARHGITGFALIGFSGGANIAALIAARRQDIISLRTIVGNLDHEALNNLHHVSQIPASLNARDYAPDLSHLPQHHFIGAKDEVVTPAIIESFIKASGATACIRTTIVPEASHTKGWNEKWAALLELPIDCHVKSR